MIARLGQLVVLLGFAAACSSSEEPTPVAEESAAAEAATAAVVAPAVCQPTAPLAERASPYDSVMVNVGGQQAKVCYGRPSVNGRVIFGSTLVPWDTLWRTGANEPTIIHLPFAASIAGVQLEPGSYSIYTVPGRDQWSIVLNRSTSQWGVESQYTLEVRAQEVGRGTVAAERTGAPVETFVITAEETPPNGANLILEWENTRVRVPIQRV